MTSFDPAAVHRRLTSILEHDVIPFWLEYGVDEDGGLNTCITDEGEVVSRDKWLWSQWRAVWVFSRLYRRTGNDRYIELARRIMTFACAHGWTGNAWRLCVTHDGAEVRGADSIYVDAFAMYGLAEFARATGDGNAVQWLRRTAGAVWDRLQQPHDRIPHFPYPIPAGLRVHGLPMIFSLCFLEAADLIDGADYLAVARQLSDEVFTQFYRADRDLVLERIKADGSEASAPEGTAVVPGHVIESMWFHIHIGHALNDRARIDKSVAMIKRHLELGWDERFGGILLAVDADGAEQVGWLYADYKLWWPQTEAMYATLRAYEETGAQWCIDWYQRVETYCYAHYPHPAGEWRQRLMRDGGITTETVALPVKDPFHLPRALILSLESLERMQVQP